METDRERLERLRRENLRLKKEDLTTSEKEELKRLEEEIGEKLDQERTLRKIEEINKSREKQTIWAIILAIPIVIYVILPLATEGLTVVIQLLEFFQE